MFIKTVHLHSTYVFPNFCSGYGAGFQSRCPRYKTAGWLQGQLSLSFFSGQLNEYQGD